MGCKPRKIQAFKKYSPTHFQKIVEIDQKIYTLKLGQSDTMTFSLGLVERPEFIYTVNAKMYGEDLIHQIGNAVEFYSGKMVIANSQTQRGFSIRSVLYFGFCNKLKQILNVEILDILVK